MIHTFSCLLAAALARSLSTLRRFSRAASALCWSWILSKSLESARSSLMAFADSFDAHATPPDFACPCTAKASRARVELGLADRHVFACEDA